MKERPILFSAPMVRAILDGRKTVTRRVVKPQPSAGIRESVFVPSGLEDGHGREIKLKYGQPGDRLWVRERFAVMDRRGFQDHRRDSIKYDVNPESIIVQRPSIHMPRWASRITLEITGVRVERLQAGSTVSFYREGVSVADPNAFFARLWDSINGPGAWDKNPWVWVVEFKKI